MPNLQRFPINPLIDKEWKKYQYSPYDVKHAKNKFSLKNCMIRIIENGVAADLRKTEATSDL